MMMLAALLVCVEAAGVSIYDALTLPARVSAFIVCRGGIQEGRHREHRHLGALAAVAQYTKLPITQALDQAEKIRYPMLIQKEADNKAAMKQRAQAEIARMRRESADGH